MFSYENLEDKQQEKTENMQLRELPQEQAVLEPVDVTDGAEMAVIPEELQLSGEERALFAQLGGDENVILEGVMNQHIGPGEGYIRGACASPATGARTHSPLKSGGIVG